MSKKPTGYTGVATITITPENKENEMDVSTGGLSKLVILDYIVMLSKLFAQELLTEAEKHVGKNKEAQERWIEAQRQKGNLN